MILINLKIMKIIVIRWIIYYFKGCKPARWLHGIGGAALLGEISATICVCRNPYIRFRGRWERRGSLISKLGGYYIRLKHLSCIIHIKTLLKHIKTLLYQLKLLQFFDYYIILYHMSEINYYINYITSIISIIFEAPRPALPSRTPRTSFLSSPRRDAPKCCFGFMH
jgi:hypothetical protein